MIVRKLHRVSLSPHMRAPIETFPRFPNGSPFLRMRLGALEIRIAGQRAAKGGGKLGVGGGRTYRKTPPPKLFWTPPPHDTFPPPLFGDSLSLPLKGKRHQPDHPNFWGLQKWGLENTLYSMLPPPPPVTWYGLPPPLSRCPSRFEAIRANRSNVVKQRVFLRIGSRESPQFALRIARNIGGMPNNSNGALDLALKFDGSTCVISFDAASINHIMRTAFGSRMPRKPTEMITSHDILEPLKQVLRREHKDKVLGLDTFLLPVGWWASTQWCGGQKVWYVPWNPGKTSLLWDTPGELPTHRRNSGAPKVREQQWGSSKRHLPRAHPWILLDFRSSFVSISLESYHHCTSISLASCLDFTGILLVSRCPLQVCPLGASKTSKYVFGFWLLNKQGLPQGDDVLTSLCGRGLSSESMVEATASGPAALFWRHPMPLSHTIR